MVTTIAVTQAISTLREAHERFHLSQVTDESFFDEWRAPLPDLTTAEVAELTRLKNRYLYYMEDGEISEGTANIILVSPLLGALGLCDPPYRIRGEQWMRLALETDGETGPIRLEGRIDALTLQDNLWLVVVEGKRGGFSVLQGIPQTLAYMMAKAAALDKPGVARIWAGDQWVRLSVSQAGAGRQSALRPLSQFHIALGSGQ
jgi:hypothetical protein